MTKKKTIRPQFAVAGTLESTEAPVQDAEIPDQDVADLLEEFGGGGAWVLVYKWGKRSATEWGWLRCAKLPASELDVDSIPATYGYGRFRFVIKGQDGRARKHLTEVFAEPTGPGVPSQSPAVVSAPGASTVPSSSDLLQLMIRQMDQSADRMTQILVALLGKNSGMSASDLVSAFREGRESNPSVATPIEGVLDAVKTGIEVARGGGDHPKDSDPFASIAPKVLSLLERYSTNGHQPPAPGAGGTGPLAVPPAPNTPGQPMPKQAIDPMQRWAATILKEARADKDPCVWVDYMLDHLPAPAREQMIALARMAPAQRATLLESIEPKLAYYRDWVELAAEAVRDADTLDDGGDPAGGTGDPAIGAYDGADHPGSEPAPADPRSGGNSDGKV